MRMEIDFEEIARLQTQVYELKMSLGIVSGLMQYDVEDGRVTATPTRTELLAKAHKLSRFTP